MAFDPFDLCVEEEQGNGSVRYVVNPVIMYPAVIERMLEIRAGDVPDEVEDADHPRAIQNWRMRIRQISEDGYALALTPREEVSDKLVQLRIHVLVTAWKFFKASLRATGKAEMAGPNKLMRFYMLNESAGKKDADGKTIPSAYRY